MDTVGVFAKDLKVGESVVNIGLIESITINSSVWVMFRTGEARNYSLNRVVVVDSTVRLRSLIVGDPPIGEYVYCDVQECDNL